MMQDLYTQSGAVFIYVSGAGFTYLVQDLLNL